LDRQGDCALPLPVPVCFTLLFGSIVERRLLTFIVASTAFFFCYAWLRIMFAPPVNEDQGNAVAELIEEPDVDPIAEIVTDDGGDQEPDAPAPDRPDQAQWLTLGSMDPASGFTMLVTLNSRGGGIERIELTERKADGDFKYRRIDTFSGYLGYFAGLAAEDVDGVIVNVVGPGTPAEIAGIQVGDVITSVADSPVAQREDIARALAQTRPGDAISIELLRGQTKATTTLEAILTEHPLDLVRLAEDGGVDQIVGNETRLSCLLTLSQVNRKSILTNERSIQGLSDPTDMIWNVSTSQQADTQFAEFDLKLSAAEMKAIGGLPVGFKRSYSVSPGSYAIGMTVQVDNLSDQPQELAYRLEGANGITLEGWWFSNKISPNFFSGAAARDVVYKSAADGHQLVSGFDLLKRSKEEQADPSQTIFAPDGADDARNLKYIAVDAQYFTVGYVPPPGAQSLTRFRRAAATLVADPAEIRRHQERAVNTGFFVDSVIETLPAGGSLQQDLQLFAGPKQPDLLESYGLGQCIYYGWFAGFARILATLLHTLSGVGNYAVAIILLTLIVRAMMFPLSRKAAINAQKMQELAPEMKKITEKYKDDMEGKLKAQRELQQKVGFNPLAGCLPMFLQLPIFIGLYRALSVDIELRQAAVSRTTDWASNLAAPDMFSYWGDWLWEYLSGRGTGWLGPYFNILPVIVVVLFLAQQKMFMPPATDDQTRMTQKMMNIMTLMMGLFFFRVPAGLCIYFITSSLWGICERILVKKTLPSGKHFDLALEDGSVDSPKEEKSQTLAERIRSQVAKPTEPVVPPSKRKRPKSKKK
jgi:YidC/Oxa1 family membrane protein insertase